MAFFCATSRWISTSITLSVRFQSSLGWPQTDCDWTQLQLQLQQQQQSLSLSLLFCTTHTHTFDYRLSLKSIMNDTTQFNPNTMRKEDVIVKSTAISSRPKESTGTSTSSIHSFSPSSLSSTPPPSTPSLLLRHVTTQSNSFWIANLVFLMSGIANNVVANEIDLIGAGKAQLGLIPTTLYVGQGLFSLFYIMVRRRRRRRHRGRTEEEEEEEQRRRRGRSNENEIEVGDIVGDIVGVVYSSSSTVMSPPHRSR